MQLTLTKIPYLNLLILRQEGIHYFIAAPNCFMIDREGFLNLIKGAVGIGFISEKDIEDYMKGNINENKENNTDSSIG